MRMHATMSTMPSEERNAGNSNQQGTKMCPGAISGKKLKDVKAFENFRICNCTSWSLFTSRKRRQKKRVKLHLVQEVLVVTVKLAVFSIVLHHVNQQLLNGVLQLLLIPAHQLCRTPGYPA